MAGISRFNTFACPNCNAFYQVVKVEAGPETKDHEITCRVCGSPLSGREGKLVLKYFLLREAVRRRRHGASKAIWHLFILCLLVLPFGRGPCGASAIQPLPAST